MMTFDVFSTSEKGHLSIKDINWWSQGVLYSYRGYIVTGIGAGDTGISQALWNIMAKHHVKSLDHMGSSAKFTQVCAKFKHT